MTNLREHEDDIIDVIAYGQMFSDSIDNISNKFYYKQLLKKRGNDFMTEMCKISNELLSKAENEEHRKELMQIYDINILLNNKINKLDLLQKKLLVEHFDKVYQVVEELMKDYLEE
jgi:hypothetical protein